MAGGSFGGNQAKIEKMVQEAKATQAASAAPQAPGAPAAAAPAAAPADAAKEAAKDDAQVMSYRRGRMPKAEFKALYASVWEQARNKDHLLASRFTLTDTLRGQPVKLRSLTRREDHVISSFWSPTPIGMTLPTTPDKVAVTQTHQMYQHEALRLATLRVAAHIAQLGPMQIAPVPLTMDTAEKWRATPVVTQLVDYLEEMDEEVFSSLMGLVNDFQIARMMALSESMVNP